MVKSDYANYNRTGIIEQIIDNNQANGNYSRLATRLTSIGRRAHEAPRLPAVERAQKTPELSTSQNTRMAISSVSPPSVMK